MKILKLAVVILFAFCVSCSNYRLAGTAFDLPFNSIYIAPVQNSSYAPQSAAILTTAISQELQMVPNLKIEKFSDDADASLKVVIVSYETTPSSNRQSDTALAETFTLRLVASVSLRDNKANTWIFKDRLYEVQLDSSTTGGFVNQEYQSMPLLTRAMAGKIRNGVTQIW